VQGYLWGGSMIEEIIHLLGERNRYLLQFCSLNDVQINRLKNDHYDQISEFYLMRERILAVIEKIELLIEQKSEKITGDISDIHKKEIEALLAEKDETIKSILNQDLNILASIEKQKTNIISELKTLKQGKRVISSYRSGIKHNKVDEKI